MKFIERKIPEMLKYAIKADKVEEILNKSVKPIDEYKYEREINGTKIIKMLLGTRKSF